MKKTILILLTCFTMMTQAQENKFIPQISVSGEGKVMVKPDLATIQIGINNTGKDAAEVKNLNDETIDKVLKFIKKFGIPTSDYKTTSVNLNKNYDYEKKKYNFQANQTISIELKDLSKYDGLMMGLLDNGINQINNVEFKSSKLAQHQSEARKLAIVDAKKKAEDYVSVLNQKVGKAILITDNSSPYQPPMLRSMSFDKSMSEAPMQKETLAIGEIEIYTNVSVSFILE